ALTRFNSLDHGMATGVSVHRKQPNPIVLQRKTIQYRGIVRREKDLLSGLGFQNPVAKSGGQSHSQTRIQSLINIVDCEESWRLGMKCQDCGKQYIQCSFARIISAQEIPSLPHEMVFEANHPPC